MGSALSVDCPQLTGLRRMRSGSLSLVGAKVLEL